MGLKIFQKKGEILRYLGRNEGDNKLIDRMIVKGEIVRGEDGEYMLAKDILREAFILLQITQKEVGSRSEEIEKLRKELKEANESVELMNREYEKVEKENKSLNDIISDLEAQGITIQRGL